MYIANKYYYILIEMQGCFFIFETCLCNFVNNKIIENNFIIYSIKKITLLTCFRDAIGFLDLLITHGDFKR